MNSIRASLLTLTSLVLLPTLALGGSVTGSGGYNILVKDNATLNGVKVHGGALIGDDLNLIGGMSEFVNDPIPVGERRVDVGHRVNLDADARINNQGVLNVGTLAASQTVTRKNPGEYELKDTSDNKVFRSIGAVNVGPISSAVDDLFADFVNLSASYAALDGTIAFPSSGNRLALGFGPAGTTGVLNITGNQLAGLSEINFGSASAGSSVIINVDLSGYAGGSFAINHNGSTSSASHVLWNFYGASTVGLGDRLFLGTVFAPTALVTHANNDIKGQVFAAQFSKIYGQVHVYDFDGYVPSVSVPDAVSTLGLMLMAVPALMGVRRRLRP